MRILRVGGPLPAADVTKLGGPPNAAGILGRNALGWFDRMPGPDGRRYLYAPNEKALAALEEYGHLL